MSLTKINYNQVKGAVINALDYGAISADCTAMLVAAYSAAVSANASLYIPAGTYPITAALIWTGDVDVFGDGTASTIIRNTNSATVDAIQINTSNGCWVRNFQVDGVSGTPSGVGDGIKVVLGQRLRLTDILSKNNPGNGVYIQGGNVGFYENIKVQSNGVGSGATKYDGLRINELTAATPTSARACTFINIEALTNSGNGVYVIAGPSNSFFGLTSQQNTYNGFRCDSSTVVCEMYGENNANYDCFLSATSANNNITFSYVGSVVDSGSNNAYQVNLMDAGFAYENAAQYNPYLNPAVAASAYGQVFGATVQEAASGTHPIFAVQKVKTLARNGAAASVDKLINLLVEIEQTGGNLENLAALFQGAVRFDAAVRYTTLTPAQITISQNDYAPGTGGIWRLSSSGSVNITGISAVNDGSQLTIVNVGSNNIVLQAQNAGSTAANRIITAAGADVTLVANGTAMLLYDSTTARWRIINTY